VPGFRHGAHRLRGTLAITALTMTLATAWWCGKRQAADRCRASPISRPRDRHRVEHAGGSGLPIGLMPGALPSDQASRQTLKTTAVVLPLGHGPFIGLIIRRCAPLPHQRPHNRWRHEGKGGIAQARCAIAGAASYQGRIMGRGVSKSHIRSTVAL